MTTRLPRPTESTTDGLHAAALLGRSTENQAHEWFLELGNSDPLVYVPPGHWGTAPEVATDTYVAILRDTEVILPTITFDFMDGTEDAHPDSTDTERVLIDDLGDPSYRVVQRIPVTVRRVGGSEFEASFREANIAISGTDSEDAVEALAAEILDTFDVLFSEYDLGPDAAEQRRVLGTYIGWT